MRREAGVGTSKTLQKCSDRSMEVKLEMMTDRKKTDRPTDRTTDMLYTYIFSRGTRKEDVDDRDTVHLKNLLILILSKEVD